MTVPKEIFYLVDRFDHNHEAYQSGKYNETQLRREFIDPFTTKPFCSARSTPPTLRSTGWCMNSMN
jgi:hypothetical protein